MTLYSDADSMEGCDTRRDIVQTDCHDSGLRLGAVDPRASCAARVRLNKKFGQACDGLRGAEARLQAISKGWLLELFHCKFRISP